MILLVSGMYALIAAVCGRLVTGHLAWTWAEANGDRYSYPRGYMPPTPDGAQWFGAACVGIMAAMIWPLVVAMRMIPSQRWAVGAEARAVARRREQRIAQLEKELNLQ